MQIYPEVATATYSNAEGILVARTEIERRQDALHAMELQLEGWSHPLYQLAVCCLNNRPAARPTADVLCQELEQVRGVIQDLQENLGRLQLMDLVAQRDEEVRRQETSIAQLRSQLQQLKVCVCRCVCVCVCVGVCVCVCACVYVCDYVKFKV